MSTVRWICMGMLGLCALHVAEGASEKELYPWREVTYMMKADSQVSLSFIIGEGNGTPLQYSCLENPMGRGAW